MDVEILRRLHKKVNIVLVIGKVDCLTEKELKTLKQNILRDLGEHGINLYQLPECDSDEDEPFKEQDRELKGSIPFAVVGSNAIIEIAGKKVRGRMYPWGVVDVENPLHSDFIKLRTFLISTHMQDLKDTTQDVHYENFRMQCISQISQHALRERTKLKRESVSSTAEAGITDTDRLLLQKDEEVGGKVFKIVKRVLNEYFALHLQIRQMQDMLKQMQEKLKASNSLQATESVIDV